MYAIYVTDPLLLAVPDWQQHYARPGALITTHPTEPDWKPQPGTAWLEVAYTDGHIWDEATLQFRDPPARNEYQVKEFLQTFFSEAQIRNFLTSDDPVVQALVVKLRNYRDFDRPIKRDSAMLNSFLSVLVTKGVIDAATKAGAVL